ncbi:MAG: hypothetical protein II117_00885 [Clostridia bacterium]|nr:hypothetical protein [Clostridia bacterium]
MEISEGGLLAPPRAAIRVYSITGTPDCHEEAAVHYAAEGLIRHPESRERIRIPERGKRNKAGNPVVSYSRKGEPHGSVKAQKKGYTERSKGSRRGFFEIGTAARFAIPSARQGVARAAFAAACFFFEKCAYLCYTDSI